MDGKTRGRRISPGSHSEGTSPDNGVWVWDLGRGPGSRGNGPDGVPVSPPVHWTGLYSSVQSPVPRVPTL